MARSQAASQLFGVALSNFWIVVAPLKVKLTLEKGKQTQKAALSMRR